MGLPSLCPLLVWAPDMVPEGWPGCGDLPVFFLLCGESGWLHVAGSRYPTVMCVRTAPAVIATQT